MYIQNYYWYIKHEILWLIIHRFYDYLKLEVIKTIGNKAKF